MAAVAGTVQRAFGFNVVKNDQVPLTDTDEYQVCTCFVDVIWAAGTYAQADDATFAPATVIGTTLRNGRTPTILSAAFADVGDENGSKIGAGACTVSSGTVTCPLLQEDLSTERAAGAMSTTWNRPVTMFVSYKEKMIGE